MKSSSVYALALAGMANAYPNILAQLENANAIAAPAEKRQIPPFDAKSQYIDTTGKHKFNPPGPSDQRGPCPGLNAMANHGYLPHNGIATIDQFIAGTGKVFGMGVDLSTFLAVYGSVFDGDLTKWSIGGPDSRVGVLNVLGKPQGISGSHNKYEGDASPTRGDLYVYGNDYKLQLSQFQELYDRGKAQDNYDLQLLYDYRYDRFNEGIQENPYFFNAPFAGVLAQPAAWSFVYRFMANKSAEYPEGRLDGEVLKSFYAITGEDGNFKYTEGHERIPDNWYTRNQLDAYTIPFFSLDATEQGVQHPEFLAIGGNTGEVNTFTGVNPSDVSGGVYNSQTLAENNNFMCYALQLTAMGAPDILSGLFLDITPAMSKLGSVINKMTNSLGCPKLNKIDKSQFDQFPGYSESYKGYTGE